MLTYGNASVRAVSFNDTKLFERKKKNDIKLNNMTLLSKPIRFKHKIWAEDTHNIKNITKLLEEMQNMFS